ncbi:Asparagine synthetase [glutamine-hydrolyzing] 1 [Halioglobus japonicus]|nr:Asparagine synthetase [glutamine-hydrolyzing] 1 [Halioglobus japonicus]
MCGITGFIQYSGGSAEDLSRRCQSMADTIMHRGPDADGVWVDPSYPVALGHRRLSIIDLTEAGAQPMVSASGRYILSFNGEVYNFARLRQEAGVSAYPFRGHSDTEVILAAVQQLGVEKAVGMLEGMFAIALWDREERCLWLARDRVGKKPLYYGWCGNSLLFGSELKALRQHPDFERDLDRDALGQYLQYGWVSQPRSIYKNVRKMPPGSLLKIPQDCTPWSVSPTQFWSAKAIAENGERNRFTGSYEDAIKELDSVLHQAVGDRMVADVELGALLSGGIDSSMIVSLMQQQSDRPVKTFSIGFWEEKYNEAEYASAVASHLKTEHHEIYVTPDQALDVVAQLPHIYDEPFADSSQIPTYLVCKLAREQLKVVLTGDGGDEQMAGYKRYRECLNRWSSVQRVPEGARSLVQPVVSALGSGSWRFAKKYADDGKTVPRWTRKLGKASQRSCNWAANSPQEILANKFNKCLAVDQFVSGAIAPSTPLTDPSYWADVQDPLLAMLHYDYIGYLPDDILVKVDRASMAVGLEARAPLLDHRVLELAWSLPREYLFDGKTGKRVLRDLLMQYVPRELIDRPKRGFSVPIKEWLVGPLRDWAEDLLSEQTLREQGIFDATRVRNAWQQHLYGWANHSELMWSILMFQAWWREQ